MHPAIRRGLKFQCRQLWELCLAVPSAMMLTREMEGVYADLIAADVYAEQSEYEAGMPRLSAPRLSFTSPPPAATINLQGTTHFNDAAELLAALYDRGYRVDNIYDCPAARSRCFKLLREPPERSHGTVSVYVYLKWLDDECLCRVVETGETKPVLAFDCPTSPEAVNQHLAELGTVA